MTLNDEIRRVGGHPFRQKSLFSLRNFRIARIYPTIYPTGADPMAANPTVSNLR